MPVAEWHSKVYLQIVIASGGLVCEHVTKSTSCVNIMSLIAVITVDFYLCNKSAAYVTHADPKGMDYSCKELKTTQGLFIFLTTNDPFCILVNTP